VRDSAAARARFGDDLGRRRIDRICRRRRLGGDAAAAIDAETRIGYTGLPASYVAKLWTSAAGGAAIGWAIKIALPRFHPIVAATLILGTYGAVYIGATVLLQIPEAASALARVPIRRR